MIANIELKEDDFDKPTFTILATRAKKEHFFEYNEKAKKSIEEYEKLLKEQKPIFGSGKYFYEKTIFKHFAMIGASYLLLRELPIKNFYARSVIWAFVGFRVANNYYYDIWNNSINPYFAMEAPSYYLNKWKIFEFANKSMGVVPGSKLGGVSSYDKWKLM